MTLLVLVNVLGGDRSRGTPDRSGAGDHAGHDAPAEVEGAPAPQRDQDLPTLDVAVPPVTAEAEQFCPGLMGRLPLELTGELSRRVQSDSPFAYAWGEPAVVLVCGVDRPAGFTVGVGLIQIEGVQWYVDQTDPDATVWTTVDRPVHVQVSLPPDVDSAPVTALTRHISEALPYREPDPAG